jgi:hypothetical protein
MTILPQTPSLAKAKNFARRLTKAETQNFAGPSFSDLSFSVTSVSLCLCVYRFP